MDDDQFERLMERLNRMSSYIETLVIENRERHAEIEMQMNVMNGWLSTIADN